MIKGSGTEIVSFDNLPEHIQKKAIENAKKEVESRRSECGLSLDPKSIKYDLDKLLDSRMYLHHEGFYYNIGMKIKTHE